MPSEISVSIPITSTLTPYQSPANGFIYFRGNISSTSTAYLNINHLDVSNNLLRQQHIKYYDFNGWGIYISDFVYKGENIQLEYRSDRVSNVLASFFYSVGEAKRLGLI